MERLGHILDLLAGPFDLDDLRSRRRAALDRDCGLGAAKVVSDQGDELFVCLARLRVVT
jgi:hypothetical protein